MISLLQRVRQARVEVDGQVVGAIGAGLLVLVCAERGDTEAEADKLLAKMLKLRIFSDDAGKMNKSVQDLDGQGGVGGLLLVSQFTLAADTTGGNRPSFTQAAAPDEGRRLYDYLVAQAREFGQVTASLQVPLWTVQLAIPVGGALMAVRFAQHLMAEIAGGDENSSVGLSG